MQKQRKVRIDATGSAPLPKLSLKEWAEENRRKLEKAATRETSGGEEGEDENGSKKTASRKKEIRQQSSVEEAQPDSTLHDYTSATTRELQRSSTTNTILKPLSPNLTLSNRNFNVFNRPQPKEATTENSSLPAMPGGSSSGAGINGVATLPGPSYNVPGSPLEATKTPNATPGPLEVVRSSLANPQFQYLPNPYEKAPAPASSASDASGKTALNDSAKAATKAEDPNLAPLQTPSLFISPMLAIGQQSKPSTQTGPTPPASTSYGTSPYGTSPYGTTPSGSATANAGSKPTTYYPGTTSFGGLQTLTGYQPLSPLGPTLPRNSGPNLDGFYEPKSITDLHYGR
jgi:hypothetical protein